MPKLSPAMQACFAVGMLRNMDDGRLNNFSTLCMIVARLVIACVAWLVGGHLSTGARIWF
jgi:hypothetical protein